MGVQVAVTLGQVIVLLSFFVRDVCGSKDKEFIGKHRKMGLESYQAIG